MACMWLVHILYVACFSFVSYHSWHECSGGFFHISQPLDHLRVKLAQDTEGDSVAILDLIKSCITLIESSHGRRGKEIQQKRRTTTWRRMERSRETGVAEGGRGGGGRSNTMRSNTRDIGGERERKN